MKILVFSDNQFVDDLIDDCNVMVTIDDDKKSFEINRHIALSNMRLFPRFLSDDHKRHISELKSILLAEKKE